MLEVHDLSLAYGKHQALRGVSLQVAKGELVVMLGANGAGKSSLLKAIGAMVRPQDGARVLLGGQELTRLPAHQVVEAGLALVPEGRGVFGDLTVRENLLLAARGARRIDDVDTVRLDWIFGFFPALRKFWLYPAGKLSGGQKQMLAIARAIVEPRRLLLVDEPTKGLAPAIVANLAEAFRELKARRTTVLLVEQNDAFASRLGDTVAVMDDGRVVHRGPMAELSEDAALRARLLGLSMAAH